MKCPTTMHMSVQVQWAHLHCHDKQGCVSSEAMLCSEGRQSCLYAAEPYSAFLKQAEQRSVAY